MCFCAGAKVFGPGLAVATCCLDTESTFTGSGHPGARCRSMMAEAADLRAESELRCLYCSHAVQNMMFSALNSWLRNS